MIQERMDDEWAGLVRRVCQKKSGNGRRRTHVFSQKHRPPADLRPQILDHHFASIAYTCSYQSGIVIQGFGIALEGEPLSFDVELCRSGACGCESDERPAKLIVPEVTLLPTQPLHPRILRRPRICRA